MKRSKWIVALLLLLAVSWSCKLLEKATNKGSNGPAIDFTTPAPGLNVKVQLDKTRTSSGQIGKEGGSVSLAAADGSKFTLEVPANALNAEMTITLTAVKSIDGAPLDSNTPTAVQLEPSGLLFNDFATLTIVPGNEIPVKQQVVFGYEGEGKDYHLMPVDPKSKDIKIRLMNFSGAGVGSASDTAWAANLAIQASDASTRIWDKFGEYTQGERKAALVEGSEGDGNFHAKLKSAWEQYEDQVVRKEMVAAELDCRHARAALHHLISLERGRALGDIPGGANFRENKAKLEKIGEKCRRSYRVSGTSNNVSFTGEICSLDRPFSIDGTFPGGSAKTSFVPGYATSGETIVTGGGGGCNHTGGGNYTVSANEDGSATLKWTTNDTIACPGFSNSRTASFTLQLQPAPELSCP
ncbi:MAG TPA: hypothetical protein VE961_25610 [Pyrinomonadaceae bacterium]|nr:hypothetical protein [Pyrinomonadaceae bacterium]